MFYWKNALVLIVLLGFASGSALMLARGHWERLYTGRLFVAAALIAAIAVSFIPMALSQLLFALLLLPCFARRVPMVATYLFFLIWSPSASAHLALGSAYLVPFKPVMAFGLALFAGYLLNPQNHLRRGFDASDAWLTIFLLIFSTCAGLRAGPTEMARSFLTYFVPYFATYQILSRTRIDQPEMVLRLLVYAGAGAGLLCLFETARYWPLYSGLEYLKHEKMLFDLPEKVILRGGLFRAYGPFAHPLVGSLVIGMVGMALYGLTVLRGVRLPIVAAGFAQLLGLFATVSRTGFLMLAIAMVTMQVLRRRWLAAFLLVAASVLAVVVVVWLGDADVQSTADYRMELMRIPGTLGDNVWLGFHEAITNGMLDDFLQGQGIVDLVNIYVNIIVLGGVVSLIPYVIFLLTTIGQYRAVIRADPDRGQRVLAQVCAAIQMGYVFAGFFISAWNSAMLLSMVTVAILAALKHQVRLVPVAAAARVAPPLRAAFGVDEPLPALR